MTTLLSRVKLPLCSDAVYLLCGLKGASMPGTQLVVDPTVSVAKATFVIEVFSPDLNIYLDIPFYTRLDHGAPVLQIKEAIIAQMFPQLIPSQIILEQNNRKLYSPKRLVVTGKKVSLVVRPTKDLLSFEVGQSNPMKKFYAFPSLPAEVKSITLLDTSAVRRHESRPLPDAKVSELVAYTHSVAQELNRQKSFDHTAFRGCNPNVTCLPDLKEFTWARREMMFLELYPVLYVGTVCKENGEQFPEDPEQWMNRYSEYRRDMDTVIMDFSVWMEAFVVARRYSMPVSILTYDRDFKLFDSSDEPIMQGLLKSFSADVIGLVSIHIMTVHSGSK